MIRPIGGAALLALSLAACGGGRDASAAIPRERFVAANVELRTVPDTVRDAAALREQALKAHRVTDEELKAFVAAHGGDATYMADVWREISHKVDSAYEATLAVRNGDDAHPDDDSGEPTPPIPPGIVDGPRTIEPPMEIPPPQPGARGVPREIVERMEKKPPPADPQQPQRVSPSDAPPRDTRPWQPMPRPRDTIPEPRDDG
jgi:hypothetical protein